MNRERETAVRELAWRRANRLGLEPREAGEVAQYAVVAFRRGNTAWRALRMAADYAKNRNGRHVKTWAEIFEDGRKCESCELRTETRERHPYGSTIAVEILRECKARSERDCFDHGGAE